MPLTKKLVHVKVEVQVIDAATEDSLKVIVTEDSTTEEIETTIREVIEDTIGNAPGWVWITLYKQARRNK